MHKNFSRAQTWGWYCWSTNNAYGTFLVKLLVIRNLLLGIETLIAMYSSNFLISANLVNAQWYPIVI